MKKLILISFCVLFVTGTTLADWNEGDGHKMHYPQLPDPCGWDVAFRSYVMGEPCPLELADDWMCTETGPVSDIHFWLSWQYDAEGYIPSVHVRIFSDNPNGPHGWSEPNELLWDRWFDASNGEFTYRQYGSGNQGWYDPYADQWNRSDHQQYFQINIDNILNPFIQEEGAIYWLSIAIDAWDGEAGWKTSLDHWNDDAVWRNPETLEWIELRDPIISDKSLDFSFVITTEEPNEPKWLQRPDLSETGIDVNATAPYILADDFECSVTGPITEIAIWGSWLNDYIPWGEWPEGVTFTLSIHEDIPAGGVEPYSMPGELLWMETFQPGEFTAEIYAGNIEEGWLNPPDGYIFPADWTCWQYTFQLDWSNTFIQQGDPCDPIIYWLDVQAIPDDPDAHFGWKTSLDHWNDDAVWGMGSEPYSGPWNELRYPPTHSMESNSIDLAFMITTSQEPNYAKPLAPHTKWSQPPVEIDPTAKVPTYCGWDEPSLLIEPGYWKIVADDFRCIGSMPVTSIHWWGSYLYWDGNEPPEQKPIAWQIGFWSNVPADPCAGIPFSYPETLLWQIEVPADRVDVNNVGYDYFPEKPNDTCFQYYVDLEPNEVFWQDDFNEMTQDDIYWLSIAAVYDSSYEYGWGWKTRPWHWMDDAITFYVEGNPMPGIVIDPISTEMTPLEYEGESYDVSFELDTDPNYIKWEQLYTGLRHWDSYTDIYSTGTEDDGEVEIYTMAADDWLCRQRTPVSSIVWWGSYLGYVYTPCEPIVEHPIPPDYFLISVWTDVPVDDPCNIYEYSHPGRKVWDYKAYDYDEVMVGYDESLPSMDEGAGAAADMPPIEPVFRYSVRIPQEDWFCQPDANTIYWLGIVAIWDAEQVYPYPWGWTNHKHAFGDDGVQGWPDYDDPNTWYWEELIDYETGESRDLSFMLFTKPDYCCECADYNLDTVVNFLDYADFADNWLWVGPAGGYNNSDLNCDGIADLYDLKILAEQWLQSCW